MKKKYTKKAIADAMNSVYSSAEIADLAGKGEDLARNQDRLNLFEELGLIRRAKKGRYIFFHALAAEIMGNWGGYKELFDGTELKYSKEKTLRMILEKYHEKI